MIHMHAIPAAPAQTYSAEQPRIVYLTNTEVDNSGKVRAIHSHADITEIGLVYSGHGIHTIGGREYRSEPGDLILYNMNVLHQDLSVSDGEGMCFFLCGVSGLHINGLPDGHIAPDPAEYVVKSGPCFEFLLQGFEAMERGLIAQSPQVASFAQGFLTSLLAVLTGELVGRGSSVGAQQDDLSLAGEMRRYIDQNYTRNFSLEELAAHFHINRFYAAHVFSDAFDCSPMQYRTRRRVGEAQSLLTSTDCSVTYIAGVVGYDDPNRFSQVFSKIVGMPPSKYRDLSVRSQQPFRKG